MTLKNASFLALIGMALLTVLLTWDVVIDLSGVMRGFMALDALLVALVQWLASVSLLVFFAVFQRTL